MERDDIIEYSLDAHHSEEQGRAIRRKIWMVTAFLAVVTAVEVGLGAYWREIFPPESHDTAWVWVKWGFLISPGAGTCGRAGWGSFRTSGRTCRR